MAKAGRRKPVKAAARAADDGEWITATGLLRWLRAQGLKISRKNLYKTYLGARARYPLERDAKGRVHRLRALETIKAVQERDGGTSDEIARRRALADARIREALAAKREIELLELRGRKIDVELVEKTWTRTVTAAKDALRTLAMTLPDVLEGLGKDAARTLLEDRFRGVMETLSAGA